MERQQRDEWWHDHVFQRHAAQLTPRALIVGFLFGGLFSLTNLYVSAKAGVTFGMGLTASIVSYAMFRFAASKQSANRFHLLENNIVQTVAGAGGYMASAFTASLAAFMVVQNQIIPWWQAMCWCAALSCLGLVLAIPHKRRFVNDPIYPFPEGQACGVVLATLHQTPLASWRAITSGEECVESNPPESASVPPASALFTSVAIAGVLKVFQSSSLLNKLRLSFLQVPEMLDEWYYGLVATMHWPMPQLRGVPLRELTIRPSLDLAMLAVGGMMGIRLCISLLVGAVVNYVVLAPWIINRGDITSSIGANQLPIVGFRAISAWSLWTGVAMMTAASLTALIVHWSGRAAGLRWRLFANRTGTDRDPLTDVEMPMTWFWLGITIIGIAVVLMAKSFFGVSCILTLCFAPIVFVLAVLGIHATALTSITPTGAMARVSQLIAGMVAPQQSGANILLGSITAETTMHASTFCQHLRPGYMLGANPRAQAAGHVVGTIAGVVCCVPAFYFLFLCGDPQSLINDAYPFPAASVWIGVTQMLTGGARGLPASALVAALIAAAIGVILSLPFPKSGWREWKLSPIGMSLAFLIPFHISLAIFAGGFIFWLIECSAKNRSTGVGATVTASREAVCAGLMTGTALIGIAVLAIESLWP